MGVLSRVADRAVPLVGFVAASGCAMAVLTGDGGLPWWGVVSLGVFVAAGAAQCWRDPQRRALQRT